MAPPLIFACHGCDHRRAEEQVYCPDCEEVTPSYAWTDEQQASWEHRQASFGFEREAHTSLIHMSEAA